MPPTASLDELQRRISLYDDERAYKELFLALHKPLLQFANSFVQSREVAEEVVSDVFISIWERRRQLDEVRNIKVYLYICTKNAALRHLARQQKQVSVTLDNLKVELESPHHNPEQLLLTAEMRNRIQEAVDQLPPRCKIVFKLIREDGLKYREVAEILNLSVKTVDNQLATALRKIGNAINLDLRKVVRY